MPEPSLLDYLKTLFNPRKGNLPPIPALPASGQASIERSLAKPATSGPQEKDSGISSLQTWSGLAAIFLFALAQFLWAPPSRAPLLGFVIGIAAITIAWISVGRGYWRMPKMDTSPKSKSSFIFRPLFFVLALLSASFAFVSFSGNRFAFENVSLWIISVIAIMLTIWDFSDAPEQANEKKEDGRWLILLLAAVLLAAYFRFAQFSAVPLEMISDHAEKLFDVKDILDGHSPIFFERNTGREPLQFYLSAAISTAFDTGISFDTLKWGTISLAFLSLFYIFQLGKEFGGKWVGLFTLVITGMAYWPNVLARTGLRFILYPAFLAPLLLHLIWALRGRGTKHYLLAALFTGIGLMGYTAFRIVPLLILLAFFIRYLHTSSVVKRKELLIGLSLGSLVLILVLSPLIRYALEDGSLINFRIATRLLPIESPYPGAPLLIFLGNMIKAMAMPFYDAGGVWLIGLLHRPALDYFSAALLMAGVLLLVQRYRNSRHWADLFLLISVPILMMPSALSIAFPIENPALNRAGGAMIPIFVLCAIALDALVHGIKDQIKATFAPRIAWGSAIILLMLIGVLNHGMVFDRYAKAYEKFSWNSSELGSYARTFLESNGPLANVWVVAYPHWVDTRLVAIQADLAGEDFGLWPDQLQSTLSFEGEKLFMVNLLDEAGLTTLTSLYPDGETRFIDSRVEGKDFVIFRVPADITQ